MDLDSLPINLQSVGAVIPKSIDYFYVNAPALLLITVSIALYAFLLYKFYHFVAKRDLFSVKRIQAFEQHSLLSGLWDLIQGIIHYGGIFPIFVFIWFASFSILLSFMAKNLPAEQVLFVSVAFVSAIRITSYYTEDLSKDLAKLIPLALLAVALIEPNFFSIQLFEQKAREVATFIPLTLSFLVFIVLLEWALRILLLVKHAIFGVSQVKTS